jgi:hypothetical protein
MSFSYRAAMVVMFLALSGCSVSSSELREAPLRTGSFYLELPFAVVRSNVATQAATCYPGIGTNVSYFFHVVNDHPSGNKSTIEVIQDGLARRVVISVDVTKTQRGGTDVSYFVGHPYVLGDFDTILKDWARGAGKCRRS